MRQALSDGRSEFMEQCIWTKSKVPVYSYLNPHLHSFCLCMYIKSGSMYEEKNENGITHFYEHAVIRNVNSLMEGKLYQILDKFGLSLNGATYKEFVQFSINGAAVHWKEAVDIFLNLLKPLVLSEEELSTERKRIKAEIRECDREDSLEARTEQAVWKGTSLTQTITGKKKTLDTIGLPELNDFRRHFFTSENMFFYVTGNCIENGLDYLCNKINEEEINTIDIKRMNLAPVPKRFFGRKSVPVVEDGKKTELSISFDIDTSRYSDAMLCLFYDLLFVGDYCHIYQELSEKTGYIYSYEDHFERYKNVGVMTLQYEVAPGMLLKVFEKTMDIFLKMKDTPGSLDYVRAIYVDNGDMSLDDADDFNWNRAYDCHILDENYPDIEAKKSAFKKVTEEDMARMAREIFLTSNITVVVKGRKKKIKKKKLEEQMKRLGVLIK